MTLLLLVGVSQASVIAAEKRSVIAAEKPSVSYRTNVQNEGWQNYVSDGTISGTSGKSLWLDLDSRKYITIYSLKRLNTRKLPS